jgi:hypothetical protein
MTEVARSNKRHNAYLLGIVERAAAASVPSRRAQDAEDEPVKIRGVRVHRPDPERRAVDPERPIHLEVAGVAYAELNADEARQIARQLIGETLERERELPAPKLATGGTIHPGYHVARGCGPSELEADCPCPTEPCGAVDTRRTVAACEQHPAERARTMRQIHRADQCPVRPVGGAR